MFLCRPSGARGMVDSYPGVSTPGYKHFAPDGAGFNHPYKISFGERGRG